MITSVHTLLSKWRASLYEQTQDASNVFQCLSQLLTRAPQTIFEPGCGSGKLLFPLAEAGYDVLGMDMDENMLFYAEKKSAIAPMRLFKADMLLAPWPRDVDCILLVSDLMHNLATDWEYKQAQKQLIMKSAQSLKKGGQLLLDFDCPISLKPLTDQSGERCLFEGTDENGTNGKITIKHMEADEKTRLIKSRTKYLFSTNAEETVSMEEITVRHMLTLEETTLWLYRAGFCIEALYGSYDFKPFDEKNRKCVIAARKV